MATASIPSLRSWSTTCVGRTPMRYTLHDAVLGLLQIVPVFDASGINMQGWKLLIAPTLPYGATGKPYQLDQVSNVRKAGKLVDAAQLYANNRQQQLQVKQACLDGVPSASAQH